MFASDDDFGDVAWGDPNPYAEPTLPPRMKKKKKATKPKLRGSGNEPPGMEGRPPTYSSFGDRMVNGGVVSGIGMMAGAALWFFVGLAAGVIFFYPPVLFLIGFCTFLNGLFGD